MTKAGRLPWKLLLPVAALVAAAGFVLVTRLHPQEQLQLVDAKPVVESASPMVPWREPAHDMQAFFPGKSEYATDVVILSRLRVPILKRLGNGARLDANALYLYRITQTGKPVGTVLIRRAPGEHGVIEVVVAVNIEGRIVGVHVQRQREPGPVADTITSSEWLTAFMSKTASSEFKIGRDLPTVKPEAIPSATAMAGAVRALLIEFEAGENARLHKA